MRLISRLYMIVNERGSHGNESVHGRRCRQDHIRKFQLEAHKLTEIIEGSGTDRQDQIRSFLVCLHHLSDRLFVRNQFFFRQYKCIVTDAGSGKLPLCRFSRCREGIDVAYHKNIFISKFFDMFRKAGKRSLLDVYFLKLCAVNPSAGTMHILAEIL